MVKHNKIIPNQHFHKKWQTSSRGPLHIKSWFNQPGKKKSRRLKRAAKAAANAPRPGNLKIITGAVLAGRGSGFAEAQVVARCEELFPLFHVGD